MVRLFSLLVLAAFVLAASAPTEAQTPERERSDAPIKQTRPQNDPDDSVLRTPTGRAPVEVPAERRTPRGETPQRRSGPVSVGEWVTSYGLLSLSRREDGRFIGTYDGIVGEGAQINGRMRNGKLVGTWYYPGVDGACDSPRQGTTHWGKFEFTFAESGESFSGMFSGCENAPDPAEVWNGTKR